MAENGEPKKKKKSKPKQVIQEIQDKPKTAADMVPSLKGRPVVYDYDEHDIKRIEAMAMVGMSNEAISFVVGSDPATFDRQIADQKKLYVKGDRSPHNIYAALEKARSNAHYTLAKTAFDVAVKDKNPTMIIWLTKVRLGWREKIEVDQKVEHTVVYETQLVDGVIRQSIKQLSEGEQSLAIDADIEELTNKLCPPDQATEPS